MFLFVEMTAIMKSNISFSYLSLSPENESLLRGESQNVRNGYQKRSDSDL